MVDSNVNETWLTQQLGHENIKVTREHYIGKLKFKEDEFCVKFG